MLDSPNPKEVTDSSGEGFACIIIIIIIIIVLGENKIRGHIMESIGYHRVLDQIRQKPTTPEIETQVQPFSYVAYIFTPAWGAPLGLHPSLVST
jgi:hypothetical protein